MAVVVFGSDDASCSRDCGNLNADSHSRVLFNGNAGHVTSGGVADWVKALRVVERGKSGIVVGQDTCELRSLNAEKEQGRHMAHKIGSFHNNRQQPNLRNFPVVNNGQGMRPFLKKILLKFSISVSSKFLTHLRGARF